MQRIALPKCMSDACCKQMMSKWHKILKIKLKLTTTAAYCQPPMIKTSTFWQSLVKSQPWKSRFIVTEKNCAPLMRCIALQTYQKLDSAVCPYHIIPISMVDNVKQCPFRSTEFLSTLFVTQLWLSATASLGVTSFALLTLQALVTKSGTNRLKGNLINNKNCR